MKSDQNEVKKAAQKIAASEGKQAANGYNHLASKSLEKGILPKDLLGINDQMVEGIYAQAFRMYQTGRYKEACQLFRLLIMMNSLDPKFTLGLAACYHMMNEYKTAVEMYTLCGIIDGESPIPHYHASDCYLKMKNRLSAIISLELAIKRAGDKKEYAALKDRAAMTIASIKKELNLLSEKTNIPTEPPK